MEDTSLRLSLNVEVAVDEQGDQGLVISESVGFERQRFGIAVEWKIAMDLEAAVLARGLFVVPVYLGKYGSWQ